MDDLPDEGILLDIFHRLPIKSIGMCMCVNKKWLSLIKNPSFVSSHKNKNNHQYLVFWRHICELELRMDNREFDFHKHYNTPHQAGEPVSRFGWGITTCNGVVCLENKQSLIMLWNPTIRKSLTLPNPNFRSFGYRNLGFWFDSFTNDYKLIRFISWPGRPTQVEIFSLNENSWRILSATSAPAFHFSLGTLPLLNGNLHWVIHYDNDGCSILAFDVNAAVFREIEFPNVLRGEFFELAIYKETSLAICCGNENVGVGAGEGVWVMKEYGNVDSWTNIWQFDETRFPFYGITRRHPNIIGLLNDGKVLCEVVLGNYMMTFSIDLVSGELARFPKRCSFSHTQFKYFEESIVLLDNDNAMTL